MFQDDLLDDFNDRIADLDREIARHCAQSADQAPSRILVVLDMISSCTLAVFHSAYSNGAAGNVLKAACSISSDSSRRPLADIARRRVVQPLEQLRASRC